MLAPVSTQAALDAQGGMSAADNLARDFQRKLDKALEQVEERRLMGACRAVQRFTERLGRPVATLPLEHMRAAS
jgi:hypothetical protein